MTDLIRYAIEHPEEADRKHDELVRMCTSALLKKGITPDPLFYKARIVKSRDDQLKVFKATNAIDVAKRVYHLLVTVTKQNETTGNENENGSIFDSLRWLFGIEKKEEEEEEEEEDKDKELTLRRAFFKSFMTGDIAQEYEKYIMDDLLRMNKTIIIILPPLLCRASKDQVIHLRNKGDGKLEQTMNSALSSVSVYLFRDGPVIPVVVRRDFVRHFRVYIENLYSINGVCDIHAIATRGFLFSQVPFFALAQ